MLEVLTSGWIIALMTIIPLGVQNVFVLKQGIIAQHILWVCLTCILCDVILMGIGIFGMYSLFDWNPQLINYVGVAAILFLLSYALITLKAALTTQDLELADSMTLSLPKTLLTTLAVTLLNPHVYLDTVFIIGSAAEVLAPSQRLLFWVGASTAPLMWFFFIGYGVRPFNKLLKTPTFWRILNLIVALIMGYIAFTIGQFLLS